ncbi:MAG: DUF3467 domain-containing protein [Porphyromonadaceae bacterium]|nr:DUF3467 domain-containing protein [Porphyromonadaceae bacterium]
MESNESSAVEFKIDLPEDIAEGIYSNMALVSQSPEEFVIDFVRMIPGRHSAKVHSRVILNPANTKRLLNLLGQHVYAHEQQFGKIFLAEELEGSPNAMPEGQA